MISVFSRLLTDEVKLRFGARFSKNDFGALSLGCVMPEGRFKSWNLMAGVKVDQLAQSIVQAFLRYGLPVIEKVTSLGAMRTHLEVKRVESGDHNELLDLIAPSCLAYLEGDNDACTRYLERMLVLDSRLANGDAWAAKFRPSRERIAKFLQAVRVSGQ